MKKPQWKPLSTVTRRYDITGNGRRRMAWREGQGMEGGRRVAIISQHTGQEDKVNKTIKKIDYGTEN